MPRLRKAKARNDDPPHPTGCKPCETKTPSAREGLNGLTAFRKQRWLKKFYTLAKREWDF
ncbi:hypothetical protein [Campylobacter troglodytis]|uniref:hypothetical protein n=1 Tax=Campylobacter troglodytis TaxID=654363 RepID=UPI001156F719|nr:hypothetical protein [Campylobacter troglodytis]